MLYATLYRIIKRIITDEKAQKKELEEINEKAS